MTEIDQRIAIKDVLRYKNKNVSDLTYDELKQARRIMTGTLLSMRVDPHLATQLRAAQGMFKEYERRLDIAIGTEAVRTCRACGCTDTNCSQCVKATGSPCYWTERDLCSRCDQGEPVGLFDIVRGIFRREAPDAGQGN